jgi:DNA (cytosine-5)-methyltransferase 1
VGEGIEVREPVLFDLCCKAGGTSRGYQQAGFYVVGVDIEPQPRYIGNEFIQMDALKLLRILIAGGYVNGWCLADIAAFGASPHCQGYSATQSIWGKEYPMQIEDFRKLLKATGKPYAIENVPGAPLENPLMLCGTMFGLPLVRHRLFECNPPLYFPPAPCAHTRKVVKVGRMPTGDEFVAMAGHFAGVDLVRAATGIDWMIRDELSQAIPPVYTRHIGRQFLEVI